MKDPQGEDLINSTWEDLRQEDLKSEDDEMDASEKDSSPPTKKTKVGA